MAKEEFSKTEIIDDFYATCDNTFESLSESERVVGRVGNWAIYYTEEFSARKMMARDITAEAVVTIGPLPQKQLFQEAIKASELPVEVFLEGIGVTYDVAGTLVHVLGMTSKPGVVAEGATFEEAVSLMVDIVEEEIREEGSEV